MIGNALRNRVVALACAAATIMLLVPAVQAQEPLLLERHIIVDRHGWQRPVDAAAALVPADWKTTSGIDWMRRCSADKIFDTRFVTRSADGRRGLQMLPGLKLDFFDIRFNPDAFAALIPAVPGTEGMLQAQMQQQQMEMQQKIEALKRQIAGTDCHWSPAIDARTIVERFVIPRRAPGGRVIAEEPLPEIEQMLARQAAQLTPVQGSRPWQQARRVRIAFNNGGVATEADLVIVAYGVVAEGNPNDINVNTMHTTWTFPIVTRWAPAGELDAMSSTFDTIEQSWRFNPRWSAATAKVRANIAAIEREGARRRHEIWMQTQREISDMQMQSWQSRQDTADQAHQDFLDVIHEVRPMLDPVSGHEVDMPIHYDDFYVSDQGQYLALEAGQDPGALYPDQVWTEMTPAR
ncbi:hypothetical protein [Roseitalea porphyridii]|uniref:Uncharacterized protein n=1 Tax=Roseitalea porphyridii TaxID=1852022 RepID=A0A4P6UWY1_9HYPH|nr:hypothetical protein [Roseitalea porphyridii]QBK29325.1 hypothetical protein E0E05_01170 [Roseitalea porphyridii]